MRRRKASYANHAAQVGEKTAVCLLSDRLLEQEPEIGLLLPCNVVVRTVDDGCRVEIADPEAMLGIVGKEQLDIIAKEAKQRLLRVIAALESLG